MIDSKFTDADVVRALTGSSDRVVCMRFTNCEGRCLYAHYSFLAAWSGVLKNVLENTQQEVATTDCSSNSTVDRTIPLDDADTAAWEDCLALMYPSKAMFKITWDNAERLLRLSSKYDMPAVEAHVVDFTNGSPAGEGTAFTISSSHFEAHLSDSNAASWLELASTCGLDQQVNVCLNYIMKHLEHFTINMDLLSTLQPKHSNKLIKDMQHAAQQKPGVRRHSRTYGRMYDC